MRTRTKTWLRQLVAVLTFPLWYSMDSMDSIHMSSQKNKRQATKEKSNHAQFVVCVCGNWSKWFSNPLHRCLKSIYYVVSHSIYRISLAHAKPSQTEESVRELAVNFSDFSRLLAFVGFGFGSVSVFVSGFLWLAMATSSYVLWLPVDGSELHVWVAREFS